MDVVYVVKFGNHNPELRIGLRSLVNFRFQFNKVVIAGFIPSWVNNVYKIPVKQEEGMRYQNTTNILRTVCADPEISDDFILMNDDFFINQPIEFIPTLHRGKMIDYIEEAYDHRNKYAQDRYDAYRFLRDMGIEEPLNYDLHTPMIFNKQRLSGILDSLDKGHSHKRSVYGNMVGIGGTYADDVKIHSNGAWNDAMMFVSTSDDAFRIFKVGQDLKKKFKQPSIYERNKF